MDYRNYIKNLDKQKISGFQTCIVENGKKELFSYGYKSMFNEDDKVTNNTLYDTASLTKVLTIVPIICRLIDAKDLKFETKLKDILPEFKYDDVTIYDLLVHQSGISGAVDMKGKEQSRQSLINEILKLDKKYKTTSCVEYSDFGYILLGLALERVYNMTLSEIAKSEVFDLLKMNNTMYNPIDKKSCAQTERLNKDTNECYQGIIHDWKARLMDGVAGHAGVFSTASDIGSYASMALNNGWINNKQYISEELMNLWYKRLVIETTANRDRSLCYIVGNNKFVIKNDNEDIISFHGFTGPSISLDRKNNLGIVLMANSVHPNRENKDYLNEERPKITSLVYKQKIYKNNY